MKVENKTTRHVVGPIMPLIYGWQLEAMKKSYLSRVPEVNGIVFSNEGSKGREPLFDASRSKTKDIMAYWNDKEKGILEISAPEPGYELKTPKTMKDFFTGPFSPQSLQISLLHEGIVLLTGQAKNSFHILMFHIWTFQRQ